MDYQNRAKKLLFFFGLWGAVLASSLFYYTVYARDKYMRKGDEISLRRGIIPALRGQILDKNGVKLAWSEIHYDLILTKVPKFYLQKSSLFSKLKTLIGGFKLKEQPGGESLIMRDIQPELVKELEPLVKQYRDLTIRLRTERRHLDDPAYTKIIGDVKMGDSGLDGISGLEYKYNDELKGKAGSYVVMVDSQQKWIPGKWTLERKVQPGTDIILDKDLSQLLESSK